MEEPKNENYGGQRDLFVQIYSQYAEKSILSTDRAFQGLENDLYSFSVCNEKVTQNCMNPKLLFESELF